MRRSGFALIEVLLVISILGTMTGLAVPLYRDYQIRNDLNLATEQVTQGLARARLLAESGQDDDAWGFYVPAGTLYKGDSYGDRDANYDEIYPMPSTIMMAGLSEVSYEKLTGDPSGTGSITLLAINQDSRTILIIVEKESIAVVQDDRISICHRVNNNNWHTLTISDNAWPAHQAHGDTLGPCPAGSSSSSSSAAPSSSSSSVSSSVSSAGGGGGGEACEDRFTVAADGTITTTGPLNIRIDSLGSQFRYGTNGPEVPVTVSFRKKADTGRWSKLFGGDAINGTGGATQTLTTFKTGDKLFIRFWAQYFHNGWLSYDSKIYTNDGTKAVRILRNGDLVPTVPGANGQQSVAALLQPVTVDGRISVGEYDAVIIADFNRLYCLSSTFPWFCSNDYCTNCSGVDYQDGVLLVKFLTPSC